MKFVAVFSFQREVSNSPYPSTKTDACEFIEANSANEAKDKFIEKFGFEPIAVARTFR